MTTCPSGVDYMHLVEIARGAHRENRQPQSEGSLDPASADGNRALSAPLPVGDARRAARPADCLAHFKALQSSRTRGDGRSGAARSAARGPLSRTGHGVADGRSTGRVILLAGCAQQVLRPQINDATIRLFARGGIDVIVSAGAGCCGALSQHIGREEEAVKFARANVVAWSKEIAKGGIDAVIINTSGCGTTVKDYGHLLRHETEYAKRAKDIAAMAKDVTEFLDRSRHRRAEAMVEPQGRLSRRVLAAARPARDDASRRRC